MLPRFQAKLTLAHMTLLLLINTEIAIAQLELSSLSSRLQQQ